MTIEEIKNSTIESAPELAMLAIKLGLEVSPVYKIDDSAVQKEAIRIITEEGISELFSFIKPAFRNGKPKFVKMDKGSVIAEFDDIDLRLLKELIIETVEKQENL